ncbi:MFS transporter [Nocardioides sp. zg-ZUI104]|uniref:MFS transporter n=1 Tax=Nocardioides faecalis TaxID=2803858 RepID=UPI001BD17729|nr:MFS transporter [Nocardioides faecalis]MBS4752981.1 MFS transporter [Nocardioides faecalis]
MELTQAIRQNPMSRYQWLVVAICILITMVDGYEILVTSYALPALTEEWGLSNGQQGLVASLGTLGMGVGAIFLSPLADRIGRRRHIIGAMVLITVFMSLSGMASSFETFLVFRFISGLFLGAIVPSVNVLVAEFCNQTRRGAVMGVYGIGLPLGAALGGFLSVWLIDSFTWRGPFFFSAILTALLVLLSAAVLPESVSFLVGKRPKGALRSYNRIAARIGVAPAAALPPAPVRAASATFARGLFQGIMLPRTLLLWLAYGTLIASFYFANSLTAKLVSETTGDPEFGITAQSLVAAGGVVGALLFALLARWIHPRLVTGLVMVAGFGIFFAFANYFTNNTMVLILAVLVGLAVNGGLAAYYAISPSIYSLAIRSAAVGLMMGLGRAIAFFAPNIATALQSRGFSPEDLFRLYGGVLAVSAVAVVALHLTYRGQKDAMDLEEAEERALDEARAAQPADGRPVEAAH